MTASLRISWKTLKKSDGQEYNLVTTVISPRKASVSANRNRNSSFFLAIEFSILTRPLHCMASGEQFWAQILYTGCSILIRTELKKKAARVTSMPFSPCVCGDRRTLDKGISVTICSLIYQNLCLNFLIVDFMGHVATAILRFFAWFQTHGLERAQEVALIMSRRWLT